MAVWHPCKVRGTYTKMWRVGAGEVVVSVAAEFAMKGVCVVVVTLTYAS